MFRKAFVIAAYLALGAPVAAILSLAPLPAYAITAQQTAVAWNFTVYPDTGSTVAYTTPSKYTKTQRVSLIAKSTTTGTNPPAGTLFKWLVNGVERSDAYVLKYQILSTDADASGNVRIDAISWHPDNPATTTVTKTFIAPYATYTATTTGSITTTITTAPPPYTTFSAVSTSSFTNIVLGNKYRISTSTTIAAGSKEEVICGNRIIGTTTNPATVIEFIPGPADVGVNGKVSVVVQHIQTPSAVGADVVTKKSTWSPTPNYTQVSLAPTLAVVDKNGSSIMTSALMTLGQPYTITSLPWGTTTPVVNYNTNTLITINSTQVSSAFNNAESYIYTPVMADLSAVDGSITVNSVNYPFEGPSAVRTTLTKSVSKKFAIVTPNLTATIFDIDANTGISTTNPMLIGRVVNLKGSLVDATVSAVGTVAGEWRINGVTVGSSPSLLLYTVKPSDIGADGKISMSYDSWLAENKALTLKTTNVSLTVAWPHLTPSVTGNPGSFPSSMGVGSSYNLMALTNPAYPPSLQGTVLDEWLVNGKVVGAGKNFSYTPTFADIDATGKVTVQYRTWNTSVGAPPVESSSATSTLTGPKLNPVFTGTLPTTMNVGIPYNLTVQTDPSYPPSLLGNVLDKWLINGKAVGAGQSLSYTPSFGDIDATGKVTVQYQTWNTSTGAPPVETASLTPTLTGPKLTPAFSGVVPTGMTVGIPYSLAVQTDPSYPSALLSNVLDQWLVNGKAVGSGKTLNYTPAFGDVDATGKVSIKYQTWNTSAGAPPVETVASSSSLAIPKLTPSFDVGFPIAMSVGVSYNLNALFDSSYPTGLLSTVADRWLVNGKVMGPGTTLNYTPSFGDIDASGKVTVQYEIWNTSSGAPSSETTSATPALSGPKLNPLFSSAVITSMNVGIPYNFTVQTDPSYPSTLVGSVMDQWLVSGKVVGSGKSLNYTPAFGDIDAAGKVTVQYQTWNASAGAPGAETLSTTIPTALPKLKPIIIGGSGVALPQKFIFGQSYQLSMSTSSTYPGAMSGTIAREWTINGRVIGSGDNLVYTPMPQDVGSNGRIAINGAAWNTAIGGSSVESSTFEADAIRPPILPSIDAMPAQVMIGQTVSLSGHFSDKYPGVLQSGLAPEWHLNGRLIGGGLTSSITIASQDVGTNGLINISFVISDTALGNNAIESAGVSLQSGWPLIAPVILGAPSVLVPGQPYVLSAQIAPSYPAQMVSDIINQWFVNGKSVGTGPVFTYIPTDVDKGTDGKITVDLHSYNAMASSLIEVATISASLDGVLASPQITIQGGKPVTFNMGTQYTFVANIDSAYPAGLLGGLVGSWTVNGQAAGTSPTLTVTPTPDSVYSNGKLNIGYSIVNTLIGAGSTERTAMALPLSLPNLTTTIDNGVTTGSVDLNTPYTFTANTPGINALMAPFVGYEWRVNDQVRGSGQSLPLTFTAVDFATGKVKVSVTAYLLASRKSTEVTAFNSYLTSTPYKWTSSWASRLSKAGGYIDSNNMSSKVVLTIGPVDPRMQWGPRPDIKVAIASLSGMWVKELGNHQYELTFSKPGNFLISSTITDDAGHSAVSRTVYILATVPTTMKASLVVAGSRYNKAPGDMFMWPKISGLNASDRVIKYTFLVNDVPVDAKAATGYFSTHITNSGSYRVQAKIETRFGGSFLTPVIPISFADNQLPQCVINVSSGLSSDKKGVYYVAVPLCADIDGSVKSITWKLDGVVVHPLGKLLIVDRYPLDTNGNPITTGALPSHLIEVDATDNSGAVIKATKQIP